DARRALWRGIDQLATAVRITLGPRGRSVVLDRAHGLMPAITRDGIAVAQELELPDPFENMGVHMLREVALRTGQEAGDGTSTATDAESREVARDHPLVRVVGGVLPRPADIVPARERATAQERPLLGVCDEIEPAALAVRVGTRLRGTAPGVAVHAPGTGTAR